MNKKNPSFASFYEIVNQAQEEGKKQARRSGGKKKTKKQAFVSTTIREQKSAFKPTNCVDNYGKICWLRNEMEAAIRSVQQVGPPGQRADTGPSPQPPPTMSFQQRVPPGAAQIHRWVHSFIYLFSRGFPVCWNICQSVDDITDYLFILKNVWTKTTSQASRSLAQKYFTVTKCKNLI